MTVQPFKKISVIGCGGIGGSIVLTALAGPDQNPASAFNEEYRQAIFSETKFVVVDVSPNAKERLFNSPKFLELERQNRISREMVEERVIFTTDPSKVQGSELVDFAIPVDQYATMATQIAPYIDIENTVITDEGSVKEAAIERAVRSFKAYFEGRVPAFVGYHIPFHDYPTKTGFLVDTDYSTVSATKMVERFRKGLGAEKFFRVDAAQHDVLYGTSSHLNYLNMSAFLNTSFMQTSAGKKPQKYDPGNWIRSMVSIAKTSPSIWPGILMDNKKALLQSAAQLRGFLEKHAELLNKEGSLDNLIDELHPYASDKSSDLMSSFDLADYSEEDLKVSAFAAFFSAAATANVNLLENQTGVTIADYANPSCRQALGIMASNPETAKALIRKYAAEIPAMLADFISEYEVVLDIVNREQFNGLLGFARRTCFKEAEIRNTFYQHGIAQKIYMPQPVLRETAPRLLFG